MQTENVKTEALLILLGSLLIPVSKFKLWFNTIVNHRLTSNKLPFCIQDVISSHPMNNKPYRNRATL